MDQQKSLLLNAFCNQLEEFISSLLEVLNNNIDLLTFQSIVSKARKANPKIIIDTWHKKISLKYCKEIENGDINFFLSKNYNNDISSLKNKGTLGEIINKFKNLLNNIGENNQKTSMEYLQNLLRLSQLYFN